MYIITPSIRGEVRTRTSDGTVFPVGTPFESEIKIDEIRKAIGEGRTVEQVQGEDAPPKDQVPSVKKGAAPIPPVTDVGAGNQSGAPGDDTEGD